MVKFNITHGCTDNEEKKSTAHAEEVTVPKVTDLINNNSQIRADEISQTDSYSHLYRRKTKWELSRLSFSMMGIEIVYAVATSVISPLLLMYGMGREQVVLVWAISPVIGFLFSPILGSLSDRCEFSIGRRRPFIIFLATLNLLGLMLVANSYLMGRSLGDKKTDVFSPNVTRSISDIVDAAEVENDDKNLENYRCTVMFVIAGTILIDFSSDTLLNPCRAYILDVCITDDHHIGLSASMIMAGIGGFIGYFIGYINWNNTILSKIVGSYVRIIFSLVAILFVACIVATITTFKEEPLPKKLKKANSRSVNNFSTTWMLLLTKTKHYLKSTLLMPQPLRTVYVTNLLCCMAHVNFYLYFTHFVGSAVFKGDPTAPPNTSEYISYSQGVRFGCLALSGNSVVSVLYSLVSGKVIEYIGLKYVYICTILLDAVSLLVMAVWKTKISVVAANVLSGIMYSSLFTVPYMLVARYHSENLFIDLNQPDKRTRGLGTDLSIVGSCICVAQFLTSLCIGPFMTICGVTFAVIGTSSILGFVAVVTASRINYLDL